MENKLKGIIKSITVVPKNKEYYIIPADRYIDVTKGLEKAEIKFIFPRIDEKVKVKQFKFSFATNEIESLIYSIKYVYLYTIMGLLLESMLELSNEEEVQFPGRYGDNENELYDLFKIIATDPQKIEQLIKNLGEEHFLNKTLKLFTKKQNKNYFLDKLQKIISPPSNTINKYLETDFAKILRRTNKKRIKEIINELIQKIEEEKRNQDHLKGMYILKLLNIDTESEISTKKEKIIFKNYEKIDKIKEKFLWENISQENLNINLDYLNSMLSTILENKFRLRLRSSFYGKLVYPPNISSDYFPLNIKQIIFKNTKIVDENLNEIQKVKLISYLVHKITSSIGAKIYSHEELPSQIKVIRVYLEKENKIYHIQPFLHYIIVNKNINNLNQFKDLNIFANLKEIHLQAYKNLLFEISNKLTKISQENVLIKPYGGSIYIFEIKDKITNSEIKNILKKYLIKDREKEIKQYIKSQKANSIINTLTDFFEYLAYIIADEEQITKDTKIKLNPRNVYHRKLIDFLRKRNLKNLIEKEYEKIKFTKISKEQFIHNIEQIAEKAGIKNIEKLININLNDEFEATPDELLKYVILSYIIKRLVYIYKIPIKKDYLPSK